MSVSRWSLAHGLRPPLGFLTLTLVSGTKEGAFEEKLRADLPILVFIVPEV